MLLLLLLLLLAPLAARSLEHEDVISSATTVEDVDVDEDSDSAPFLIVVEHEDKWRCGGSLLSLRTAVTTARCALGTTRPDGDQTGGKERELWVFASTLLSTRPPAPLAAAARRVRVIALGIASARSFELALLELERPFDATAVACPILLPTSRRECEGAKLCNAVHALPARGQHGRGIRLRVVDVALTNNARCAAHVPLWPPLAQSLVCFAGEELCENDLGGGVVCDGRLCAVLGDTAANGTTSGLASKATERCSGIYAALSVAHWRRFLHCAHTQGLCGRGDCAQLCLEHRLLPADDVDNLMDAPTVIPWKERTEDLISSIVDQSTWSPVSMTRTRTGTLALTRTHTRNSTRSRAVVPVATEQPTPAARPAPPAPPALPAGRSLIFEPNRADFKVILSRTTLVPLKAGEYGDNAAEYEGEEPLPPPTRTTATASAAPTRTVAAAPALPTGRHEPPALEQRVSPVARSAASSMYTRCKLVHPVLFY